MKLPLARALRAAAVSSALLAGLAAADQILEVYSGSLTTFLAGKTGVQDAKPRAEQRAVNLDGSLRKGSPLPMAIAGNPFENVWGGEAEHNGVQLDTGTWAPTEIDLSLPAPGHRWVIGRTYNARQDHSGQYDSNGYQGRNWFQTSQPEIVLYDDADNSKDLVYLVLGADRYAEFQRVSSTSNQFKGKNGAAGVFDYKAGTPDLYVYTDLSGNTSWFFGFDTSGNDGNGQLWRISNSLDPADSDAETAYVGDASNAATAVANGFDDDGRMLVAYDTADRRYTYTYTTLDSVKRLTQVKAETKTGGTWSSPTGVTEVGKVEYTYYSDESYGDVGALETVKITTPLSDSGVSDVRVKYYRYWEGTYNASTNPGYPYALQLVVDFEGTRRFDWGESGSGEPTFDDGFLTAATNDLKPYASAYLEYDTSHRINKAWFAGACGCSGAGTGTHEYRYEPSGYTNDAGYDNEWARRASVERPDSSWLTQYFDETGQPLSLVITDIDPAITTPEPKIWVDAITRDTNGCVQSHATPENLSSYTHSSGVSTPSTSNGLYWDYDRYGSGTYTGFLNNRKRSKGSSGTDEMFESFSWTSASKAIGDVTINRPLVSQHRVYDQTGIEIPSYSNAKSFEYFYYGGNFPFSIQDLISNLSAVSTSKNGSGSSVQKKKNLSKAGRFGFMLNEDGTITYQEYTVHGLRSKLIEDADTAQALPGQDFYGVPIPTGYSSSGPELHLRTTFAYDPQGRLIETALPDGRVTKEYVTKLADRRLVQLSYPKYVSASTYYGPVQYTITNHAGKIEAKGVIAYAGGSTTASIANHIDENDDDPITAVDTGSVAELQTYHYDETGTVLEEERAYFSVPSSEPGTDGTHYDPTAYGYDASGRQWRIKEACGTIHRKVFDLHGREIEAWIGKNDSSFSGGEASGADDMVKTSATEFDEAGDSGNGYVTKTTTYVEGSTNGQRVTTFGYTWRGWMTLQVNPVAPHFVYDYDNQGRNTKKAGYSSSANITKATNPETYATDRVTYETSEYDEEGRVWKTVRCKIDQADGSNDDSLETLRWFASDGRLIKEDGAELKKWTYDRLGGKTHEFTLAQDNDTSYSDATGVVGDIVLVEEQWTFDDSNMAIMFARIERHHSDYGASETTGALDTNQDGDPLAYTTTQTSPYQNIKGRIQITAMWYDALGRIEDSVQYGTYDGFTFDRDGLAVPARSDTALRTTYVYYDSGRIKESLDPRALKTRYEYDALGRPTKVIANWDDGTPGGADGDEDQTVAYGYVDGLRTTVAVDLPSGTDQVTTSTYGTTKGTGAGDSKIATGHLLSKITFPDSEDANDVVTFAYNAQEELVYRKDQAGNVLELALDVGGREENRRVTALATGFDGAVQRISTTYDTRGYRSKVTQYDHPTTGAVVDEVKFSYDDWGNLVKFEQDRNSSVGASGSIDDYETSYVYVKRTTGRNTLRISDQVLPSGTNITFSYLSTTGLYDNVASRVTQVKNGTNRLATYNYNGVDRTVGTSYDDVDVMSNLYGSTSDTYPDLDLFNRRIVSRWSKDLATDIDFFNTSIGWDRNSYVVSSKDNVHAGFDVKYSNDDLNRIKRAEEGTLSGGSVTSRTRDQQWTLTQAGTWDFDKVDLNGDGDFVDDEELNDDRTYNVVNELTARDIDDNGSNNFNLSYDRAGNLLDDGEVYEYVWDAFYRLRKVNKTNNQELVAEYKYNGLNYRISEHEDTDIDRDVDSNDKWYHFAYDELWRVIATYRENDTSPKEQFVYHRAGLDGQGTGSYIDLVILRDKDANTAWTSAADGTLEERVYYCQNWRADVVALVADTGTMLEQARYSVYGVPFGLPAGDTNSDGDCDSGDTQQINTWIGCTSSCDVRGDLDLDGDIDTTDLSLANTQFSGTIVGRIVLTSSDVGNRKGLAGYEYDSAIGSYSIRRRWLHPVLGMWLGRDAVLNNNLYEYVGSRAIRFVDHSGEQGFDLTDLYPPVWMGHRARDHAKKVIFANYGHLPSAHEGSPAVPSWKSIRDGVGTVPNAFEHCVALCAQSKFLGGVGSAAASELIGAKREERTDSGIGASIDLKNNSAGTASANSGKNCWNGCRDRILAGIGPAGYGAPGTPAPRGGFSYWAVYPPIPAGSRPPGDSGCGVGDCFTDCVWDEAKCPSRVTTGSDSFFDGPGGE